MTPCWSKIATAFIILLSALSTASGRVLTLDDCIELALENNKDVIYTRNQEKIASGNVWQAFGAFLPSLYLSGDATETRTERYTAIASAYDPDTQEIIPVSVEMGGVSKSYSLGGSASLTLFDGGRNVFNFLGAKADKKHFSYLTESSEQALIYNVKGLYFAYLTFLDKKEISEEAVKRGEEQYKLAKSKYEVGSASKSDVLKAQVQYGNDKLGLIETQNAVKVAHANLAYLIGVDVNSDVEFSAEFKPKKYDGTEMDALKFGLAHYPGLLASESNLTAAKYDVRSTFGRYLPSLSISVGRSWSNNRWSEVKEFRDEDARWSIRTSLSIPIFENFSRKRDMSRAKATLSNARADYYYVKNEVALNIKEAYLEITKADEALKVARENVLAAGEDMSLVQEKYNLGAATILELLDAQVSLITAQNAEAEAEFDYNLAVAKLENAMGVR
jgi:outer membrane protein TolC